MKEITTDELEHFLYHHHIIDVRERGEVATGMIPVATNIPMSEITQRIDELDKNITYTLICRSGVRSAKVGEYLEGLGFETINVIDGMNNWDGDIV